MIGKVLLFLVGLILGLGIGFYLSNLGMEVISRLKELQSLIPE